MSTLAALSTRPFRRRELQLIAMPFFLPDGKRFLFTLKRHRSDGGQHRWIESRSGRRMERSAHRDHRSRNRTPSSRNGCRSLCGSSAIRASLDGAVLRFQPRADHLEKLPDPFIPWRRPSSTRTVAGHGQLFSVSQSGVLVLPPGPRSGLMQRCAGVEGSIGPDFSRHVGEPAPFEYAQCRTLRRRDFKQVALQVWDQTELYQDLWSHGSLRCRETMRSGDIRSRPSESRRYKAFSTWSPESDRIAVTWLPSTAIERRAIRRLRLQSAERGGTHRACPTARRGSRVSSPKIGRTDGQLRPPGHTKTSEARTASMTCWVIDLEWRS